MKFQSPILEINEKATGDLIEKSISALKGGLDSFAILAQDDMNYLQTLATEHGYIVQFQTGSIDQHYEFDTYLSRAQTIELFQAYLAKSSDWQGLLTYKRINLRGLWGGLGYAIGRFAGNFVQGFKHGRKKK